MSFMNAWPAWVTILLVLALGVLCFDAWRKTRKTSTWLRRGLMVACVGIIGLTPAATIITEERISNAEYYFVVDLTGSMGAEDWNGEEQRLEGVKADMREIIEQNPGAQYSIIAFSSTATQQLPLTTDERAALSWLDTARRESTMYSQGSSINRPVEEVEKALARSFENDPQNVRVMLLFTDGESTNNRDSSADEPVEYESLAEYVDDGYVFGYGTTEGAPMLRTFAGEEEPGNYITDQSTGEPGISKLNEEALQEVASQLDIEYVHRTTPSGAGELVDDIPFEMIAGDGREERGSLNPVLWPVGLVLIALVGWELWYLTPKAVSLLRGTR